MVSPIVYARRSLEYFLCDQPNAALRDAMQAQCVYPDWPTAFYMQAIALTKPYMDKYVANMLKEGAAIMELTICFTIVVAYYLSKDHLYLNFLLEI